MEMTSTRDRRRTVTRLEVVAEAVNILDRDGVDKLTMANVSARVGLTTMGVYRHVKNRDDLVTSAVALILEEVATATADDRVDWFDGVMGWMNAIRACLLAHPWAATRLGTREGGSSDAWTDAMRSLARHLAAGDLSPDAQARAFTWTVRLTVGFIILEIGGPIRRTPGRSGRAPVADALAKMTDEDFWADLLAQTRSFLTSLSA